MGFVALFSGGKDSTMALYRAIQAAYDVQWLVSMISRSEASMMYHVPNIHLTKYSAEALGIPIVQGLTSGEEGVEVTDLKEILAGLSLEGIVAGAVSSTYQKRNLDRVADELELEVFTPYWGRPHEELVKDAIKAGFDIRIVAVAAEGLGPEWLGRKLDSEAFKGLLALQEKYGINVGGEGGDFETFVCDGPIFKKKIEFVETEKTWDGQRGQLFVKRVRLCK